MTSFATQRWKRITPNTRPTREFFRNVSGWLIQSWATAVKKTSSPIKKYFAGSGCSPEKIRRARTSTNTPKIPAFIQGFDSSLRIHSFGVDFRRVFGQAKPFLINFLRFADPNIGVPSPKLSWSLAEHPGKFCTHG